MDSANLQNVLMPANRNCRFSCINRSSIFASEAPGWEQSNHIKAYLGEWHTHDQDNPSPSFVDKRSWLRISKRNNNFDQSCFIIVGHKEFRLWNIANGEIVEQKGIDYGKE